MRFIRKFVESIAVEFGTSTQLVPIPADNEFVCTCKCQPVWSEGHERLMRPPLTDAVIFVGFGFTAGGALMITRSTEEFAVSFDREPVTIAGRLARIREAKPLPPMLPV